ncbi:hypothetical protein BC826DRAFT_68192 [Russula brevipes]|nr:hypothetical protein BC826DRAFT_68192 [Russula brevipes]
MRVSFFLFYRTVPSCSFTLLVWMTTPKFAEYGWGRDALQSSDESQSPGSDLQSRAFSPNHQFTTNQNQTMTLCTTGGETSLYSSGVVFFFFFLFKSMSGLPLFSRTAGGRLVGWGEERRGRGFYFRAARAFLTVGTELT